jgi:hypothetical protein
LSIDCGGRLPVALCGLPGGVAVALAARAALALGCGAAAADAEATGEPPACD